MSSTLCSKIDISDSEWKVCQAKAKMLSCFINTETTNICFNLDPWNIKAMCNELDLNDGSDHVITHIGMPPPKPYFERSTSSSNMAKALRLTRARSSSPPRPQLSKRFSELRGLTQSMPSICSSRAAHNRVIGCVVLQSELERRSEQKEHQRAQEFEALLESL